VRALLALGVLAALLAIPAAAASPAASPAGTIVFSRTVGEQAELF
jgi:hypothetical protein